MAYKLLELLTDIFNTIELYSVKGLEREVFEIVLKENVTIYDTSYIYIVMMNNLTLITDDEKLKEVSSKYTKTITSNQIVI
ncbi:MAG: type II toxin-antitoxin system VapC family toxin [Candidatus Bathyarchaeia archaeon]